MASQYWFRFDYPKCPSNLNENQQLKKYQILQYNSPSNNGNTSKIDKYKLAVSSKKNISSKIKSCTGYNPPTASNVPSSNWNLFVTKHMLNQSSIINNTKNNIPKSGNSTWDYTKEHTNHT